MYSGGISFEGDEVACRRVLPQAIQLANLTRALKDSAGLDRLTKEYDLAAGGKVLVTDSDYTRHMYVYMPHSSSSSSQPPSKRRTLTQTEKNTLFLGISLVYTVKEYYEGDDDWDQQYLHRPLIYAKAAPDGPLLPYYYEPDDRIPDEEKGDDEPDSRFNVEAYESMSYPPGPQNEFVPGAGYVKKAIPDEAKFLNSDSYVGEESDYQWTWFGDDNNGADILKFLGTDNRWSACEWDPHSSTAFFDETNNVWVEKPSTGDVVYANGIHPGTGRMILGGGRIIVWKKYDTELNKWKIIDGYESEAVKTAYYVLASIDPAGPYGYYYEIVDGWPVWNPLNGSGENKYEYIQIHVAEFDSDGAVEWEYVGAVKTEYSADLEYRTDQRAVFSSDGLEFRQIITMHTLSEDHWDWGDSCLTSATVSVEVDLDDGKISFHLSSSDSVRYQLENTTTGVDQGYFDSNPPREEGVLMFLYRINSLGQYSETNWDSPVFGMKNGIDFPATRILVSSLDGVDGELYNKAPIEMDYSIPTEALTFSGGYTGLKCEPSNGFWVCPANTIPYMGGALWVRITGEKIYAKHQSLVSYLGWGQNGELPPVGIPNVSFFENLIDYRRFPIGSSGQIVFTDTYTKNNDYGDFYYTEPEGNPVSVDYKKGEGFVYARLKVEYSTINDETEYNEQTNTMNYTRIETTGTATRWKIYTRASTDDPWTFNGGYALKRPNWISSTDGSLGYGYYTSTWQADVAEDWQPESSDLVSYVYDDSKPYKMSLFLTDIRFLEYSLGEARQKKSEVQKRVLETNGSSITLYERKLYPMDKYYDSFHGEYSPLYSMHFFVYPPSGIGPLYGVYWIGALEIGGRGFEYPQLPTESLKLSSIKWLDMRRDAHLYVEAEAITSWTPWDYELNRYGPFHKPATCSVVSKLRAGDEEKVVFSLANQSELSFYAEGYLNMNLEEDVSDTVCAFLSPTQYVVSLSEPTLEENFNNVVVRWNSLTKQGDGSSNKHYVLSSGLTDVRFDPATDKIVAASVGLGVLKRYEEGES